MKSYKATPENAEHLTARAAMEFLGVSHNTLEKYIRMRKLNILWTPTGHRRFRRSEVEALLTERKPVPLLDPDGRQHFV